MGYICTVNGSVYGIPNVLVQFVDKFIEAQIF